MSEEEVEYGRSKSMDVGWGIIGDKLGLRKMTYRLPTECRPEQEQGRNAWAKIRDRKDRRRGESPIGGDRGCRTGKAVATIMPG